MVVVEGMVVSSGVFVDDIIEDVVVVSGLGVEPAVVPGSGVGVI